MPFISYAQNFEDVMLYRGLKGLREGFYIDVGAHDPVFHSVTKAFYDRGWHGINVEPVPASHERLARDRPRDINLLVSASDGPGETTLYQFAGTGLSTTSSTVAESHEQQGFDASTCVSHKQSLKTICDDYAIETIHFLKIDVEGSEEECLRGNDFSVHRPWIVVVESTAPMSTLQQHLRWEPILLNADYEFVYFDGLNRFYVSKERCELSEHFLIPPNVFDDFIRVSEVDSENEVANRLVEANNRIAGLQRQLANGGSLESIVTNLESLQSQSHQLTGLVTQLATQTGARNAALTEQLGVLIGSLEQAQSRALMLQDETAHLRAEIHSLQSSLSWRLTSPLRAVRRFGRS
ncbi:MAG: FkbM family methyltransferase [Blastocatellia bacterium]|nr:FkbM family methyltransferase [Blastocatellia bacterium]